MLKQMLKTHINKQCHYIFMQASKKFSTCPIPFCQERFLWSVPHPKDCHILSQHRPQVHQSRHTPAGAWRSAAKRGWRTDEREGLQRKWMALWWLRIRLGPSKKR